jgi:hypothetical protein
MVLRGVYTLRNMYNLIPVHKILVKLSTCDCRLASYLTTGGRVEQMVQYFQYFQLALLVY